LFSLIGGTADLTVHKRKVDGNLEEVYVATGGAWGGVGVDRQFLIFITKLMGPDVMKEFSSTCADDLFDMYRCLETLKRIITPSGTGNVTINIPASLCDIYKKFTEAKFGNDIPEEFQGQVVYTSSKLKVDMEVARTFFAPVVEDIVNHMEKVLSVPECACVKTILMVGGFSESKMVSEAVEKRFPKHRLIVPVESEMAVLKGAVIFGHAPETISNRVMRYTYGVNYMLEFDPEVHPEEKRIQKGDDVKCKDLFEVFVEEGQLVRTGEVISKTYSPATKNQKALVMKIYVSTKKSPKFVTDEGCWKLGKLVVQLPETEDNTNLDIDEKMIFGETELRVEAVEPVSGKTFTASFDFL